MHRCPFLRENIIGISYDVYIHCVALLYLPVLLWFITSHCTYVPINGVWETVNYFYTAKTVSTRSGVHLKSFILFLISSSSRGEKIMAENERRICHLPHCINQPIHTDCPPVSHTILLWWWAPTVVSIGVAMWSPNELLRLISSVSDPKDPFTEEYGQAGEAALSFLLWDYRWETNRMTLIFIQSLCCVWLSRQVSRGHQRWSRIPWSRGHP